MSANVETSGFVGRALGGRWVVGEQLGSGTFGVVHAGIERGTGQAVALKLLHPQFLHHHETIARFWNEAEALRRMNHPNVLVLLDVGVSDDGVPYLVTELLTGETLRDLLTREGALPPERAMRLLGPAAHALHHAHLAGIVHRDLKPENIFRVRKDGMGTTKILDFGVAKLLDTQPGKKLSQTGIMIGTMAYSPPEQMQGAADIDHRADQFGFAALMFEALTGQRPFPEKQPFQLFQAVMSGPRPKATGLNKTLPPAVDAVLQRGLDADRERRYGNVEEFYIALTQALTTPNFQGLSATFNGVAKLPELPAEARAEIARVAAADAQQRRVVAEPSARFRPIEDEATRGFDSHADDAPNANANAAYLDSLGSPGTTLPSARVQSAPSQSPLNTTLVEGSPVVASLRNMALAAAPVTTPSAVPSFVEPEPPPQLVAARSNPPAPASVEKPVHSKPISTVVTAPKKSALPIVIILLFLVVAAVVAFLLTRK